MTGPTGEIGSELVRFILASGGEAIAIVRPGTERINNLPKSEKLKIIECDISDYGSLAGKDRCDIFVHMAWKNPFGAGRDDVYTQTDNIRYALDAVGLAKDWGAGSFLGTGSQAEYGVTEEPLNDKTFINPSSGYGMAKYAAGRLCGLYCSQLGIKFNWVRIASVFGIYDGPQTLIMYLINALRKGDVPDLTRCEQVWDYIYAKDVARALYLIGTKGKDGKTYCIGSGKNRTLKEFVTSVRDTVRPGAKLNFGAKDYYPHQPMKLQVDISDLISDTGFRPEYTFEEGIREILEHLESSEV